jgi:hypothetical protein
MNAYFWRTGDNLVHHMRAESVADVRDRIAAIHGDEIARQAIVTSVKTVRIPESSPATACA